MAILRRRGPQDRDYYQLSFDLNRGCGGSTPFLWLYYLPGMENDTITPIAEIATLNTSDGEILPTLGAGFKTIDVDVNRGAGGE